ncbi:gamma-mobile-trio protein GmtX [Thalassotalea piscium]
MREKYRALIASFAENHTNKAKYNKKENWIDEIESPKHRSLVQMLASELATTKQKLNEIIPPHTVINVYDYNKSIDEYNKLTSIERRVLEYILSDSFKKSGIYQHLILVH